MYKNRGQPATLEFKAGVGKLRPAINVNLAREAIVKNDL